MSQTILTVGSLIAELQRFDPTYRVLVMGCCSGCDELGYDIIEGPLVVSLVKPGPENHSVFDFIDAETAPTANTIPAVCICPE